MMASNHPSRTVCFAAFLLCILVSSTEAMRLSGTIQSEMGSNSDVYLGSFVFESQGGVVRTKTTSHVAGQRILFFDETEVNWGEILATYDTLACQDLRKISLVITENADDGAEAEGLLVPEGTDAASITVAPTDRPRKWYVMISNCQDKVDIDFDIWLENPGGFWNAQFSVDEQGILQVYTFLTLVYTAVAVVTAKEVYRLKRSSNLHSMVWSFCGVLGLQVIGVWFIFIHGSHYAADGYGYPFLQAIGEVFEWLSNIGMAVMLVLLAKGWAITTAQLQLNKQWTSGAGCLAFGMISLLILERAMRDADTRTVYATGAGLFSILVRVGVGAYFVKCFKEVLYDSRGTAKETFIKIFGAAGCLWFFSLPIIALFTLLGPPHTQARTLVCAGAILHALALAGIGYLIWPRTGAQFIRVVEDDDEGGATPYDEI